MQLLIVSDTLAGGTGSAARTHAAWFASRNWEVSLVAPLDGPAPVEPVRFIALPAVGSLRRIGEVRRARAALRAAWRSLGSPAIVHVHGMRSFVLCRLAGLPRPFVSVHGAHPSADDPRGYHAIRQAWFALLPRLSRGATSAEPTQVRGYTYTPFGSPLLATLDELPFPAAESPPTVAWLGLFDERKQPEVFVRAVAALSAAGVVVRGVMGGTGDRFGEIKELVASLDAPVELRGHADPVAVLRDAWVLALFSHSEGTPLVVMEAMWAGRSVVASDLPGNAFLIGDTGALANDVAGAAAALRAVVTSHEVAFTRGAAAAARVRTLLDVDTPWPQFEAMYRG